MKRSVLRDEKDELEAEQQRQVDDEHWVLDIPELAKKEQVFYSSCIADFNNKAVTFKLILITLINMLSTHC